METIANSNAATKITSFDDLKRYANGSVVRFSDFAEGQPFVARVRRPSLMGLAKNGRIPNALLETATELFGKGGAAVALSKDENVLSDMHEVCHIIADASLIEPTLAQIEEAGMELSDKHYIEIFQYSQTGIKALESFRQFQGDTDNA